MKDLIRYLDDRATLGRPARLALETAREVAGFLRWYDAVIDWAAALRLEPSASQVVPIYNVTIADSNGRYGETLIQTIKLDLASDAYDRVVRENPHAVGCHKNGIRVIKTTHEARDRELPAGGA